MSNNPIDTTQDVASQIATIKPPSGGALQLSKSFKPITDDEAWALANRIKNSNIIPKDFIGKPENIFIAILMGREVGLHPMQSVQNIMVVNGRPSMWGDALPALVYASNKVEKFEEDFDEKTLTATCTVRRTGDTKDHVQKFSHADAVKAGYDKKPGPWQTNEKRMLQMRARAFGLRDKFADVLKGLGMIEEAMDYEVIPSKEPMPMPKRASVPQATEATIVDQKTEHENQDETSEIGDAQEPVEEEEKLSIDERKELLVLAKKHSKPVPDISQYLMEEFKISSSADLPKSKFEQVKNWIQGKLI